MKRIALFGGSFDPVHKGHIQIINALRAEFDEVRVIPCGNPPHKHITPSAARIDMLRLCIPADLIDTVEVDNPQVSYTCDTLAHYRKQCEGDKLFYCIGADSLAQINTWKNPERIAMLGALYVIKRKNYDATITQAAQFYRVMYGGEVEISEAVVPDISSSELRVRFAFGDYSMVSAQVGQYIKANGLYRGYDYIVSRYKEFGLTDSRVVHTKRVAVLAAELAALYYVPTSSAILAALLHDIGKSTDRDAALNSGYITQAEYDELSASPASVHHALIGARIAAKEFGVTDGDVLNAIASHTTGRADMSQLEKVILLADYLEEGRDFDNVVRLRQVTFRDLDDGLRAVLANTLDYLTRQRREIDERTTQAYNYYND